MRASVVPSRKAEQGDFAMAPLAPYRVLDLTDDGFLIAGQLLADLGCDVVVVEPPDGLRSRRVGPWAGDEPGRESSLTWHSYNRGNRGKQSVVIDLESAEGRHQLSELMSKADIVLESFPPGYLEGLRLGYEAVRESNPGLVHVTLSPFGQDGPKAGWAASDLTVLAASGVLHLTGDPDRAPLAITVPQAYLHAGSEAVVGALIALHSRNETGVGQFIDVSAQQATMIAGGASALAPGWNDQDFKRSGSGVLLGGVLVRVIYECSDGHVSITAGFGNALGRFTRRMFELIHSEGLCDEVTRDKDWLGYPLLIKSGVSS
jgi:crotonobetainyl-CoA:carnitine CoA-transferase CaiB-like acyl-CoA transferase